MEGKNITYHVVQTFGWLDGEIVADEPREMPSAEAARHAIDNLPGTKVGGVAFSRTGNPTTGEFADAVIIAQKGTIPTADEEFV